MDLRVGIGAGEAPTDAGIRAKHALERGRETGKRLTPAATATPER
ncbi:MAG: GTP cyclohydrolase III [Natronomonas sp.]